MPTQANVPFLPGHVMNDVMRTNHRRAQTLIYKLDAATDAMSTTKVTLDKDAIDMLMPGSARGAPLSARGAPLSARGSKDAHPSGAMTARGPRPTRDELRNTYKPAIQPAWLKYDRQVLRFYAYFQEPVVESNTENYRFRNVVITYFLEDNSLQVTEPKVENSGIWPQGPFVKRHKITKPDGRSIFGPADLKCGTEVTLYSRTFRVLDADPFTKEFYAKTGLEIGETEGAPLDTFTTTTLTPREKILPAEVKESKEYTELKLGGSRKNHGLDQFLANDRKVLRFYAYWDDPTRYGVRMYFVVHYFLSDDTVEINNNYARNSGRDPYPVFFTRGPLELNPTITTTPGMIKPPSPLLGPKDIQVGQHIKVYGRKFFVYDCDEATAAFYKGYLGRTVEPVKVPDEKKRHTALLCPPYNGFGSEEDSLNSCLQLRRAPPRKDLVKLMNNSDRILRFEAIAENNVAEDAHRKFIIGIFLSDDSVAVWELRQRNSGCVEGKFKERAITVNPATGIPFTPADFFVGARVKISAMPFRVMRADEYTLKWMEADWDTFPMCSYRLLGDKLQGLEEVSKGCKKLMTPEEFRHHVGTTLGFALVDQELVTILRGCCPESGSGFIDTEKMFQHMREGIPDPPPLLLN